MDISKLFPMTEDVKNTPDLSDYSIQQLDEQLMAVINGENVFTEDTVISALNALKQYSLSKYKTKYPVLSGQTQELNDMYIKIKDMLAHDKFARFRHRNDRIDFDFVQIVLVKKKPDGKIYEFVPDALSWDTGSFEFLFYNLERIYRDKQPSKDELERKAGELTYQIYQMVYNENIVIIQYQPVNRHSSYNNLKLEAVIKEIKERLDIYYGNIAFINGTISRQVRSLKMVEATYNDVVRRFDGIKDAKKYLIEPVFMEAIKYAKMSIDYNNTYIDLATENFKFFYDQLVKIYDIIRS